MLSLSKHSTLHESSSISRLSSLHFEKPRGGNIVAPYLAQESTMSALSNQAHALRLPSSNRPQNRRLSNTSSMGVSTVNRDESQPIPLQHQRQQQPQQEQKRDGTESSTPDDDDITQSLALFSLFSSQP